MSHFSAFDWGGDATLPQVLGSRGPRRAFLAYCKQQHCLEVAVAVMCIAQFRRKPTFVRGAQIITHFLTSTSPVQANLPTKALTHVSLAQLNSSLAAPPRGFFDPAYASLVGTLIGTLCGYAVTDRAKNLGISQSHAFQVSSGWKESLYSLHAATGVLHYPAVWVPVIASLRRAGFDIFQMEMVL